ncbi:Dihydropteroate synthase-like protein [Geopyxis carbonaria]|nr:Dihydropteroate synthase-like protein [Geopyxis carbonaria]
MHESPSSEDGRDLIFVRSLNLKATTGVDGWQRPKPQPILLSLWLKTSVALAGSTDHLPYSIHYGIVCKTVSQLVENGQFNSLEHLAEAVCRHALGPELGGEWVKVAIEKPRALLRADAAGISIVRRKDAAGAVVAGPEDDRVTVKDLRLVTIIGVNPWEREERQNVVISLTLHKPRPHVLRDREFDPAYNFRAVVRAVTEHVENSDYKTVEAFVTAVAREVCVGCGIPKVTVRAEKPSALTFAASAGVEITREKSFFEAEETKTAGDGTHDAFLALGSNLGDRHATLTAALAELGRRGIAVRRTSCLYQSAPMYVTDQPAFLNGVVQVRTTLSPEDLLTEVKAVEAALGRVASFRNGPRALDIDILLYDALVMNTPDLTIPHASMLEREFVLAPLCDLAPERAHPLTSTAYRHHLAALPPPPADAAPLQTFTPLTPALTLSPSSPTRGTHIMAILNLTPDSFSDGGTHTAASLPATAHALVEAGATILDLGGCSTRPGAPQVSEDEETARVVPAVAALRAAGVTAVISVDTYRASVARAAVEAGADVVNDVSAGTLDPAMLATVAELGVPVVLMHTRGTPETMGSLTQYSDIVTDVARELAERVSAAEAAGVRRWNILLDPGLGFAKTHAQSLELLRRLGELRAAQGLQGLPWVVGPSRKGFVGRLTGVETPKERGWGTAGAVAASVAGGADVVRVHDVGEMRGVVEVAVGVWRG